MDGGLVGWEVGIAADTAAVKSKRRVGLSKVYLQAGRGARVYCKRTQENGGKIGFLAGRWGADLLDLGPPTQFNLLSEKAFCLCRIFQTRSRMSAYGGYC
jgi:hypothetical protein